MREPERSSTSETSTRRCRTLRERGRARTRDSYPLELHRDEPGHPDFGEVYEVGHPDVNLAAGVAGCVPLGRRGLVLHESERVADAEVAVVPPDLVVLAPFLDGAEESGPALQVVDGHGLPPLCFERAASASAT